MSAKNEELKETLKKINTHTIANEFIRYTNTSVYRAAKKGFVHGFVFGVYLAAFALGLGVSDKLASKIIC